MNKFFLLSVCSFAFFLSCSGNAVRKIADGNVDSLRLSYLEQGAFFYETALENGFENIAAVQRGYTVSTDEAKDSALYYAEKALELDPENVSALMFKLKVLYINGKTEEALHMLETDKALRDFTTKGVETNKILTNHIKAREFDIAGNSEKAMMMLGKNVELCEDFMRKFSGKENELMADMQTAMTKGSGYVSALMIYLFYLNSIDPEKAKETLEDYKKNYPEVSELLDGIGEIAMFPDQWRKRFPL